MTTPTPSSQESITACDPECRRGEEPRQYHHELEPGAERLLGYTEAIGKPITMLIPPDRHDEESNLIARIRRGERVEHYETSRSLAPTKS